jgi:putative flippase GtrA
MRLNEKAAALVRRVARYGGVGFIISLIYNIAIAVCLRTVPSLSHTITSIVAFVVILPLSFAAHRRVSFSERLSDSFEALGFMVSTTISFVFAVGGMYVFTGIARVISLYICFGFSDVQVAPKGSHEQNIREPR